MIRVLITGCSIHSSDLITELRSNADGEEMYIVGMNCNPKAIPRNELDKEYIVPRINDPCYVDTLYRICKEEKIDVVMPFVTAELELATKYRARLAEIGTAVSVSSPESLKIVGDKIALGKRYPEYMPRQMVMKCEGDLKKFCKEVGYPQKSICCKLTGRCGGLGFAILNENKGRDITIYNKYGVPRYITFAMFRELYRNCPEEIILQEYEEGVDYSMCILADHGRIEYALGFKASVMVFGSAVYAEICQNDEAFDIAKRITEETGLDGNACFDFIINKAGRACLLEVNPRVSATLPFIARAGLNLPYLRCKQLLGQSIKGQYVINENLKMMKTYKSEYFE